MLNLAGKTDGTYVSSLKPWINVMVDMAARLSLSIALFTGLSNPTAMAQVQTPFATGVTQPLGGLVLSGTAINPQTQQPYRHLWSSDTGGFGLCRLDPDVDTPGPHAININTCLPFVAGVQFKPGQLAFDPALNNIYAVDLQANTDGVFRLHFAPTADGGHGALDLLHQEILGGTGGVGHNGVAGCAMPGNVSDSAVLGPDSNLYIGFKASGNIVRMIAPQTDPFPCSNIQVIGTTPDRTKNFGLGWIGHDLFGGDGVSLWTISSADQCMTPQNGQLPCQAHNILTAETATPTFVMTDQIYPATNGTNIYVATPASVTLVNMITITATQNYASGFEFLGALALDPTDFSLYAADDPTDGKFPVQGRWFALGNGPVNGGRPPGTLTEFASGVTSPIGGLILAGTAINPNTGKPYRHLWTSDLGGFGLCRLDPDVDTSGPHTINPASCLPFVAGVQFKPGELAYDPLTNDIYAVDLQANTQGIFRLHYLPDGGGGHGAIDPLHTEVLGGSPTPVEQQLPGCGIPGNVPDAAVLGPDGALYVGFKASGNILRINSPQTEPLPCSNVQVIGTTPDNRKDFGLGFIGHDLFGGDGLSAWIMVGADVCLKPGTGNTPCQATSILVPQTASPSYVMTDQVYPALNGRNLFVGKPGSITLVDTLNLKVSLDYATGFQFLSGMALDPTNQLLYAADDPTDGKIGAQGHWWLVGQPQPFTPAAPGVPTNVTASPGDAQTTLSWTPAADGQAVTSFTVHNSFASDGALLPDIIVNPPAGSVTAPATSVIQGLTNGVTYQFTVAASNTIGTSAFSSPSNSVTPQAVTIPDSPTNVIAQGENGAANIAWTAPASNGGAAITSYTVSALTGGAPTGLAINVAAPAGRALFSGLTNGTTYTFVASAANSVGSSVNSAPSNSITPAAPAPPPAPSAPTPAPPAPVNVALTISGPTTLTANSSAGYEILITNSGNSAVAKAIVTDTFTGTAVTVLSATPSQGSCTIGANAVVCTLGSLGAGSTVAIGITETLTVTTANAASIKLSDASGNIVSVAVPGSDKASVTTTVSAAPPPPGATPVPVPTPTPTPTPTPGSTPTPAPTPSPTPIPVPETVTDLALSGHYASSNGQGTISWNVQNLGSSDASNILFVQSLPTSITSSSLSATLGGSCTESKPIGDVTLVICRVPSLASGQSWNIQLVMAAPRASATIRARVRFDGNDPVPANNYYLLAISKAAGPVTGGGGSNPGGRPLPGISRGNLGPSPLTRSVGRIPRQ